MSLRWKIFWEMRQRSQIPSLQVMVRNYNTCKECSTEKKYGSSKNIKNPMLYTTCIAVAASVLGISYYTLKYKRNVYAFNATQNIKYGQLQKDMKTFTLEEVGKHDSKEKGIWVTFGQGVYDITEFVDKHPGGPSKIMMAAGGSIDPFWMMFANHNTSEIHSLLESMRIGNISEEDAKSNKSNLYDPYANEPVRHKALKINGNKPFCAEPSPSLLVESFLTPVPFFYVRNHLPVPEIELKDYTLELAIEGTTKKTLDFKALNKYEKRTITAAVMCGGNRRSEMSKVKQLKGINWNVGAVGNATWTGVRLCDVLKDLGVNEDAFNHVQFEGYDLDPSGMPYGASIPISKAIDPRADVILAYEMNGETLSQDHGFPVRVIVPGVVGARNVKWLSKINISKEESQSQWQQGDYKGFSPSTTWNNVDFNKSPAIQEMPVVSAICDPQDTDTIEIKNGKIQVKGYAWSGGGRKIIRVDVTNDKGKTWHTADLTEDLQANEGRHWSWSLWNVELPVDKKSREVEIWAKAVDSSYNVQPESFNNIYNIRGLLCNAYHKIKVQLKQ
ncbi:putative sulfite oxidase, mitochondrial [Atta colombica]|uniref:Sulfite oxidase n=1 Tax=Atta colombica TaxID=520822 RepID=A0A195BBJ9_9HYME|nr:PREDICTED: probable sulfite oxidase, mitochondrial [Atta colombica]KYM81913.1 putative sulfite oxidase, mitochondrial [Atta colombica]